MSALDPGDFAHDDESRHINRDPTDSHGPADTSTIVEVVRRYEFFDRVPTGTAKEIQRELGAAFNRGYAERARAEHLGDCESVAILAEHAPYAIHCRDWEVLAWPCPIAADTLNYIVEETP